jgi:hypothetical protein
MPRRNSNTRKSTRTRGGAARPNPQHRRTNKAKEYNRLAADLVRRGLASRAILGPIAPPKDPA